MVSKSKLPNKPKLTAESARKGLQSESATPPPASPGSVPPATRPDQTAIDTVTETNESNQEHSAPDQKPSLSAEELRKRAVIAKQTSASFGDIVRLLMQSNEFKKLRLEDLNGLVVPAIATGQFLTAEAQSKTNGAKLPIATVLWASVSEEVDRRFSSDLNSPVRLAAQEWKSGGIPWLIAAAGDQRLIADMLRRIQNDVFKGRPIKLRSRGPNGQTVVTTVEELQKSRNSRQSVNTDPR
jgi:hemolysin-activating ACP:hemolysin acyltransferase